MANDSIIVIKKMIEKTVEALQFNFLTIAQLAKKTFVTRNN